MTVEVRGVCTLLLVFDMPKSLGFYRDVLGFEVVATNDDDAGDDVVYVSDPDGYLLCFQREATPKERPVP